MAKNQLHSYLTALEKCSLKPHMHLTENTDRVSYRIKFWAARCSAWACL